MENNQKKYDVAIIGGGLGGLSLAIQLARKNFSVILFEKEKYPFHKVCGEYISLESWDFLVSLGLELDKMNLPIIKKLVVTSPNGKKLEQKLINLDNANFIGCSLNVFLAISGEASIGATPPVENKFKINPYNKSRFSS